MTEYARRKEAAREEARRFQDYFAGCSDYFTEEPSWGDLAVAGDHFEKLARRYGLTREFRENGII